MTALLRAAAAPFGGLRRWIARRRYRPERRYMRGGAAARAERRAA